MTAQLAVNPKDFGLEEVKANEITSGLTQILSERDILTELYKNTITKELNAETITEARELRIKIRDNRTKGIEAWHKVNKEFYLRGGQFVDAIKKREIAENERMEDNLMQIEKHFENIEKEKQEKLHASRIELIRPYIEDVTGLDFRTMQDDVFEAFLTAKKNSYEAKIEAEKKAEADRIEADRLKELHFKREKEISVYSDYTANIIDINATDFGKMTDEDFESIKSKLIEAKKAALKKQEAQRIENERLKKEAAEAEAKAKKEREEAERKQREIEEKARIEREAIELKAKKEREAIEQKAREEKAKQDAIIAKQQAELKAKQDAENLAAKQREEAELKAKKDAEKLAKAPIKKQLSVWVDSFALPESSSQNETSKLIEQKFNNFKSWAKQQVEAI